jgi:inorganic pyrophosphatase
VNIEAVVEIPQGSRNKYEMDHERGRISEVAEHEAPELQPPLRR